MDTKYKYVNGVRVELDTNERQTILDEWNAELEKPAPTPKLTLEDVLEILEQNGNAAVKAAIAAKKTR